ncbi:AraC-like DNA-binding protein [Nocardia kruczakiae]|uniref:AraC-like DNA-binding protein n=1 Tax=Nocardia kruczakiae TaxID=261477 RepID=A0ABU1XBM5_9NOCA|nr:helix-turn-helix domain-containing protein [Nocardia kruczakiae]MDR7167859.1 AraC-like DNA-binding protein [Nocardia kruczakiae]
MPVQPVVLAGAVMDLAVPAGRGMPGVSMAGFRGRAGETVALQMIPYPALTVFVDFGDALVVDGVSGARTGGPLVVGLPRGALRGSGRAVDLLQIRLSPVVAHTVLGAGAELNGMVVGLGELWGGDAARVQEQLRAARSWDSRFAIAHAALARRLATGPEVDPEVEFVWRRLTHSRGRARIEPLAAVVGWSRQRLWSRFRAQIGITPKQSARLVRFDHVAHRLAAGHRPARVAAETGFVDQSHLHRDIADFAGMTTSAVATAPWLSVDHIAWPRRLPATRAPYPRSG